MIQIFQPSVGDEELEAVKKVFASNWLGKGEYVKKFEEAFASHCSVSPNRITSCTSCTEGLFLAAKIFEFGENDEIIAPSISFVSVGSAIQDAGAKLVICDVDRHTLNTNASFIEDKITPQTKAVYINHYGGLPCEMDAIIELCGQHNIAIIEDAACAPASTYNGRACGTIGDMGVWSFDAMKIISSGDGGLIYLKDSELMSASKQQLYLGLEERIKSGLDSSKNGSENWWEFDIVRPGKRNIMNNISGAIGYTQIGKLPSFISRRKEIFDYYNTRFANTGWLRKSPSVPDNCASSYYFYWIQCDRRDELAQYLKSEEIYTTFRYWPLTRIKYFGYDSSDEDPNTKYACDHTLNIPIHQGLSDTDIERIADNIIKFGEVHKL